MSLAIDIDKVSAVLLADGWHECGDTFSFDAYEYVWEAGGCGGSLRDAQNFWGASTHGQSSTGFIFHEDGRAVCGPMSSILAVKVGG
jgi:hypothetical protein